jgi:hypothetical protein
MRQTGGTNRATADPAGWPGQPDDRHPYPHRGFISGIWVVSDELALLCQRTEIKLA